jgi:poly-gamma-glutamate capsule biosynthesis protein CapA/YwtB (metallophosphatase superfamily)
MLKKVLGGLVLIALLGGGGVLWYLFGGDSGVPETASSKQPTPARPDHYTITWGGDTMLGWAGQKLIDTKGPNYAVSKLKPLLASDYTIINLEAPITELTRDDMPEEHRVWTYNVLPASLGALSWAGVDAFALSNNHAFDRGEQGVLDTLRYAREGGFAVFGVGLDKASAEAPLFLDTPHGKVAVLSFSHRGPRLKAAGDGTPGLTYLNRAQMENGYKLAKAGGADIVVGCPHWGINYDGIQAADMRTAEAFAEIGYDLVMAHGPHVQQPVGLLGDMPVIYSLGNFVFGTQGRFQKDGAKLDPYGLIAKTFLGPKGIERIELRCILVDNLEVKYRPRPCTDQERADSYAKLGPGVVVEGDAAVVVF